jgi:hypothetical protein
VKRKFIFVVATLIVLVLGAQLLNVRTAIQVREAAAQVGGDPFIEGRVFGEGEFIAGAHIKLIKLPHPIWIGSLILVGFYLRHPKGATIVYVESDENGYFIIQNATPGRYLIKVRKKGFVPVVGRFNLPPGKSVRLDVELCYKKRGSIIPILLPY